MLRLGVLDSSPLLWLANNFTEARHLPDADVCVCAGGYLAKLVAHSLRETTCDNYLSGLSFVFCANCRINFLKAYFFCSHEKSAGIDNRYLGVVATVDGIAGLG